MPLQERARERVSLVLGATKHIVGESGYHGLTLSAICAHAQIKQTSIYRYWPNKQALVMSLASLFEQDYEKVFTELEKDGHRLSLDQLMHAHLVLLADYVRANKWMPEAHLAMRTDALLRARHKQVIANFEARYEQFFACLGFSVKGQRAARVSQTLLLLLDAYVSSLGHSEAEDWPILIEEYGLVLSGYLNPLVTR